ncbi:DNA-directed RNA polymerase omega subunit [hydrothermal vent metagenome]|uniref:DNA-directed RNA polymerase n=1 Tax=hydrothermal vent metagenome TaxID=652676 RepID=A0A1W1D316_9ZZZZ
MKVEELTAKILEENPNVDRYQLAIAIARRGDQLSNGATTKLNLDPKRVKPSEVALMEIAEGLVSIKGFEKK